MPAFIVRRQAALERLMVRLMAAAPQRWALKGGLALETRLKDRARASMDMDIDHVHGIGAAREDLARAAQLDLGDHFSFVITESRETQSESEGLAGRFRMESALAGSPFEVLQVDVTIAPPGAWEVEIGQRPGLLAELGLGPVEVALVPLERQIAEKLHAYSRKYGEKGRASTRVRDLIDLVLIRRLERIDGQKLRAAIELTFATRKTHAVPLNVPAPPAAWRVSFRQGSARVGIGSDVDEAHDLVASWLEPVLSGRASGRWDPEQGVWR